jgi:hypothetical protein
MATLRQFPEDDPELEVSDQILTKVRCILEEHFDSGIVLLTKSDGTTSYHSTEFGNKFAIMGMLASYTNGDLNPDNEIEE